MLEDVALAGAPGQPPLLTVKEVRIPWGAALGMHSEVRVDGLRIAAVQGGAGDNVSTIVERLRGAGAARPRPDGTKAKARAAAPRRRACPTS